MSTHVSESLSAYIDHELAPPERAAVDEHLRTCATCTGELEALQRLVAYAGGVAAGDAAPARDLWPGIHARIAHVRQPRRISLSIAQLAAAAVILIAVSAGTAWLAGSRMASGGAAPASAPSIQAEIEPTPPADVVRPVNFADAQYDAAVLDLERALQERRNDLNPRTVEILERNLKLIDAAIAQARQALEQDPANDYLNRHLVESRRRKLELLRRATSINEAD